MKHLGSLKSTQVARVELLHVFHVVRTSYMLYISMNICWDINQLLHNGDIYQYWLSLTAISRWFYLSFQRLDSMQNRKIRIIVIYLDFHSTKRALWLVDSWSRAPDQIQMYPDRDTIPQSLPSQLFVCLFVLLWLLKRKSKYIYQST